MKFITAMGSVSGKSDIRKFCTTRENDSTFNIYIYIIFMYIYLSFISLHIITLCVICCNLLLYSVRFIFLLQTCFISTARIPVFLTLFFICEHKSMSSVLIKWPSTFRRTSPNDAKHRRKKSQLSHRLNFESGTRINQSALAPVRRNAIKRAFPVSSDRSPKVLPQCSKARTDRPMKRSLALILCHRVGCHRRIARDDNVNWVIRRREARVGDWNATNSLPLFPGQAIKTFGGQLQLDITADYCLGSVISCIGARVHSPSQVSRHLLISYETWLLI